MEHNRSRSLKKSLKIIQRAESERMLGNEEAAINHMAQARMLLAKHQLSIQDAIEAGAKFESEKDDMCREVILWADHGRKKISRIEPWACQIATVVAKAMGCGCAFESGTNNIHLFGRRVNLSVVIPMVVHMTKFCEDSCNMFYRIHTHQADEQVTANGLRGFKKSFRLAFSERLHERFLEQDRKAKDTEQRALVALKGSVAELKDYMHYKCGKTNQRFGGKQEVCEKGRYFGRKAANEASLSQNEEKHKSIKRIDLI